MMKTKTWILILSVIFLLGVIGTGVVFFKKTPARPIANIYVDGICVRSVDLSDITEPYEFTVETPYGSNTIRVEPGRIAVVSADCADETCVHTGWIGDRAIPIVCLPHRLVIRIEQSAANDVDAVAR